ncbi:MULTISPECIES: NAD(P)-dependent oxidoreductase [Xanthomonas]|uniref:NAD(P)-dependent oxidoreductase n=1 Tax=Xanthomonas TaxID=338 RepID=UPI001264A0F3|nr:MULTISPECIES: NAD(P)-dependent oxidoreductase [Xanthomonas]KAB7767775.1 oxidoreductase [Xanthomonas sp. LMG 12461]MCW0453917.1 3-sulfolactaldehyde reductase [Xanthomonas sacchari]
MTTIGFLGLGTMGQPIALNLLRAGHALTVWNRSAAAAQPLLEAGAQQAAQPADAVRGPVLFSMLADDTAVRETLLDRGALDALTAGSVHVNMATISVTLARELHALHAERGVAYLAMPVLGRVEVAAAGQLNLLAAGDAAALARVQPLLDVIGRKTWYFGAAPEQANAVKLAANLCLASAIGTMAEASALVRGHGVEAADFLDMLTSTVFAAPAYQTYGGMIAEQRYSPAGFKATLGLKDVRLALNAGETRHVPMPLAAVLRDAFIEAIAHGDGDLDWAALAKVAARRAGQT